MGHYYDRQGNIIDMLTWANLFEQDFEGRVVARSEIGDIQISTVWLGLDHNWGDGPPLIFETMVFGGELDQECDRYSTEEAARAGHDEMVKRVKESLKA